MDSVTSRSFYVLFLVENIGDNNNKFHERYVLFWFTPIQY